MHYPQHDYIAFTDLEMTGLDPWKHEIIEIGLIVANARNLEIIHELDIKISPSRIKDADPESLKANGYEESKWSDALSLKEALEIYNKNIPDSTIFASWNTPYDFGFLIKAYADTGIKRPFNHRSIDVFTIAYEKLSDREEEKRISLGSVCGYLKIPREPEPHSAINGARICYEIFKKLDSSIK